MRARQYYRISSVALVLLCFLNAALAVWVYLSLGEAVVNNIRIVEPPDYSVLTNRPSFSFPPVPGLRSSSPSSNSVDRAPSFTPSQYSFPYSYFAADGRSGARLNGRYVYVGSRTAFGIVSDIFPERIILDDGSFINNTQKSKEQLDYVRNSQPTAAAPL